MSRDEERRADEPTEDGAAQDGATAGAGREAEAGPHAAPTGGGARARPENAADDHGRATDGDAAADDAGDAGDAAGGSAAAAGGGAGRTGAPSAPHGGAQAGIEAASDGADDTPGGDGGGDSDDDDDDDDDDDNGDDDDDDDDGGVFTARRSGDDARLPTPSERVLRRSAVVFYALMAAAGLIVMDMQGLRIGAAIFGDGDGVVRDALFGAGAGLAVVALTWMVRRVPRVERLNRRLAEVLGQPSTATVTVLAVTSAVGEELLFRGAIQPLLGLWLTSLLFGFVHGGMRRELWLWAGFAVGAGLLLGWLAEATGNLLAPIVCHMTVNFWNLQAVGGHAERTG